MTPENVLIDMLVTGSVIFTSNATLRLSDDKNCVKVTTKRTNFTTEIPIKDFLTNYKGEQFYKF